MIHQGVIKVNVKFLREFLNRKGLTEEQFAHSIGVSHSTVNRIMNGKRNPGSKFVIGVLNSYRDLTFDQVFIYNESLPKGNKASVPN